MDNKKLGTGSAQTTPHTTHNVIEVMKPFVNFGVRALGVLSSALIHIVKNIPKPDGHKPSPHKNDKVIKI